MIKRQSRTLEILSRSRYFLFLCSNCLVWLNYYFVVIKWTINRFLIWGFLILFCWMLLQDDNRNEVLCRHLVNMVVWDDRSMTVWWDFYSFLFQYLLTGNFSSFSFEKWCSDVQDLHCKWMDESAVLPICHHVSVENQI